MEATVERHVRIYTQKSSIFLPLRSNVYCTIEVAINLQAMASSSTFFQFNLSTKYKGQIALDMIAENLLVFCVLILGILSIKALKMKSL